MNLNQLLNEKGINPEQVLVLRHRPSEPQLNKVLPWLAIEQPNIFNAYQQTQGQKVEKAMQNAQYVASFLGREAGKALYVGLYEVKGWTPLTFQEFNQRPEAMELFRSGMKQVTEAEDRPSILWFHLELTDFYSSWSGKLVVNWPGKELSWWRWANRNEFSIHAVHEESLLDAAMPDWDEINLNWDELQLLPKKWQGALQQWRGIYFIFDVSDGKGYVGSATGDDNILGRWNNYAASGHGGNQMLKNRNPKDFRFSILQLVSPSMIPKDVIQIENTWKERLHTRHPFGLNDN